MSLENAIAQYRYAFGKNAKSKGMSPPPNSVTPSILSPEIAQLFERTFDEQSAHSAARPEAREWLTALDALKGQLRTCGQESVHRYYGGLAKCPWCAQEDTSGLYFFISLINAGVTPTSFNLTLVWARIIAIASPGPTPAVDFSQISVQPRPLPKELKAAKSVVTARRVVAAILTVTWIMVAPSGFIFALIVGGLIFGSGVDDSGERTSRKAAADAAEKIWRVAEERWKHEAGDGKFQAKLRELTALRLEYESLGNLFAKEKQNLHARLREFQLHKFLNKFFLEDHNISGIGATRKAMLVSFGIETAADVEWSKVNAIRGFGDKLTREVVDWRKQLERRFVFDPAKGIDPADLAALNQRFAQRRKHLEGTLLAGAEQLTQIRAFALQIRQQQRQVILSAARKWKQAKADLAALA